MADELSPSLVRGLSLSGWGVCRTVRVAAELPRCKKKLEKGRQI